MFLPSSYIELTSIKGNPATKQALKVYAKPDQIIRMEEVTANVKTSEEEPEKVMVFTQVIQPFVEPIIVQETPAMISNLIIQALNHDIEQIQKVQRGIILAPAEALFGLQATPDNGQSRRSRIAKPD